MTGTPTARTRASWSGARSCGPLLSNATSSDHWCSSTARCSPRVAGGQDGQALVAVLEAVAVRTGVRAGPPDVGEAGDVGDLVEHPGGQKNRPRHLGATAPV